MSKLSAVSRISDLLEGCCATEDIDFDGSAADERTWCCNFNLVILGEAAKHILRR
jgi:hypothetical protein